MLRFLLNRAFARLGATGSSDPNVALLGALVREVMNSRVQRADLLAAMERLIEQTRDGAFSAADLDAWPGRILLVFGSDDPATPPEKRKAMRSLYPRAEVTVVEGATHTMALSHQDEYFGSIDGFWDSVPSSRRGAE